MARRVRITGRCPRGQIKTRGGINASQEISQESNQEIGQGQTVDENSHADRTQNADSPRLLAGRWLRSYRWLTNKKPKRVTEIQIIADCIFSKPRGGQTGPLGLPPPNVFPDRVYPAAIGAGGCGQSSDANGGYR